MSPIDDIICCPRCRSRLTGAPGKPGALSCTNRECRYAEEGFLSQSGQPVLIDFETSIFRKEDFVETEGASVHPRDDARSFKVRLLHVLEGDNEVAAHHCREMIARLRQRSARPRVLVVGGATIGDGMRAMYECDDIDVVGSDVYVSPYTSLAADAHQLPFRHDSFDGVWIQAVLEHVLDPAIAVAEIGRVLKPGGIVYADTPFMQQVHEGAYDFTRFTVSGHRWLFRNFHLVSAGAVGGVGTASIWSLRYLVRAITGSQRMATLTSILFFWLRFCDGRVRQRLNNDAASGVYFFGTKAKAPIGPRDMVAFYEAQAVPSALERT